MKVIPKNISPDAKVDSSKSSSVKGAAKKGIGKGMDKVSLNALDSLGETKSSDKVDLSSRAQDTKKAYEIASKTPDVDEAKVAKYQALIDSGKYKVDASKVADKMVDEHLMDELGSDKE